MGLKYIENDGETVVLDDDEGRDNIKTGYEHGLDGLLQSLHESKQRVKVSLYAEGDGGQNSGMTLLRTFPPDRYDYEGIHEFLRSTYGPGGYRIRIMQGNKLMANQHINILPEINKPQETPKDTLTEKLLDRMDRLQAQLIAMGTKQSPVVQQQDSRKAWLEEMLIYKQIFSNGDSKPQGVRDILDTLNGLKEIGIPIEVGGNVVGADNSFIEAVAPALGKLAESFVNVPQAQYNQPQTIHTPKEQSIAAHENVPNQYQQIINMIEFIPYPCDVELYGDLLIDRLPPEFWPYVKNGTWYDVLAALGVKKSKQSLDGIIEYVLSIVEGDNQNEPDVIPTQTRHGGHEPDSAFDTGTNK